MESSETPDLLNVTFYWLFELLWISLVQEHGF